MSLADAAQTELVELTPLLRRAVSLDRTALARLRWAGDRLALLVLLPFGVLASRTITVPAATSELDVTVGAADLLGWLDGERLDPPAARDADWRGAIPPRDGWLRIDTVPDQVVRDLVRTGAVTLRETAEREGLPGAQPRAEVADALLDSVVLSVSDGPGQRAELTLRTLSALTRLGFLARDSHIAVDVLGRWVRVAAAYGSVFAERPGSTLRMLS